MMKLLDQINSNGFVLSKFTPLKDFKKSILESERPSSESIALIHSILKEFNVPTEKLQIVFEDFIKGDNNKLHTHLVPADYQVLIWVPEKDFQGREFIFGERNSKKKKLTPSLGDICFMKTNDLNFVHGVSTLETDCLVRTIIISVNCLGESGEHLTVTTDLLPV